MLPLQYADPHYDTAFRTTYRDLAMKVIWYNIMPRSCKGVMPVMLTLVRSTIGSFSVGFVWISWQVSENAWCTNDPRIPWWRTIVLQLTLIFHHNAVLHVLLACYFKCLTELPTLENTACGGQHYRGERVVQGVFSRDVTLRHLWGLVYLHLNSSIEHKSRH